MFDRVGAIEYAGDVASADDMLEAAIEAGAEDCESDDDLHTLYTDAEALHEVAKTLEDKYGDPQSARIIWKPQNNIDVDDEKGEKLLKLLDLLEDSDDVQYVYANFEVSDELVEKMGS